MMFLFAYISSLYSPPGWPIWLMHLTEAAFIAAALVCSCLLRAGRYLERHPIATQARYGIGHRWYRYGFRRGHAA